jgi:hypothetical protein
LGLIITPNPRALGLVTILGPNIFDLVITPVLNAHARPKHYGSDNQARPMQIWCFLCSVLLLLLNQISRRNEREEGTKLIEKRTKLLMREEDNKESVEFYGMINGEKILWFAFVYS